MSAEKEHDEHQYLNLIRTVLATGETRPDRTGTGTISIFAPPSLRFSLKDSTLPLLTTKRTFLRGIVEELLWFIRGETDSKVLSNKGVKIWDGNGSKEFLEKRGLGHRREGDLGPVYGFQWRHFGAEYKTCDTDYTGQGVDQLGECIRKIKEDPTDRRIILSAWNPAGELCVSRVRTFRLMLVYSDATHGVATMSYDVPILCPPSSGSRSETGALVSHVSTIRRPRSRNSIQYRILRAPHAYGRTCHRYRSTGTHHPARRRARISRSRRSAADPTGEAALSIPYDQVEEENRGDRPI